MLKSLKHKLPAELNLGELLEANPEIEEEGNVDKFLRDAAWVSWIFCNSVNAPEMLQKEGG